MHTSRDMTADSGRSRASWPSATSATRSRSVKIPVSREPSITSTAPTEWACMVRAAAVTVSVGAQVMRSICMISDTRTSRLLLRAGFPLLYHARTD